MKLFVDNQTFELLWTALNEVAPEALYVASAYAFVINWVDDEGVKVEVGK